MIQEMMKDHEVAYHPDDIMALKNSSQFLDKVRFWRYANGTELETHEPAGTYQKYLDAFNFLNSMGKLDYGFYEMFKPIGQSKQKYIKVKLSTAGDLDISGVIALSDCEHVPWEHGSKDYLRSLNTGNQRYLFKLSIPFNDLSKENQLGSNLWWKPDSEEEYIIEPEDELEDDEIVEADSTPNIGVRYYKPYETERFLRWFGSTEVPKINPDKISKLTVCSSPRLTNDVQANDFFLDATNVNDVDIDLSRAQNDDMTPPSISLLSFAPKASIELKDLDDETHNGQYLEFVVSGHQ